MKKEWPKRYKISNIPALPPINAPHKNTQELVVPKKDELSFTQWELISTQSQSLLSLADFESNEILQNFPSITETEPVTPFPLHQSKLEPFLLRDIIVTNEIYRGEMGFILQVKNADSSSEFVLKLYEKSRIQDSDDLKIIAAEYKALTMFTGKRCFLKLLACFQTSKVFGITLDLIDGITISAHIATNGIYEEQDAAYLLAQLARGIEYLHESGVTHRDVKSDNVIIDVNKCVKLFDFEFCMFTPTSTVKCGTVAYMAPEVKNKQVYSYEVDWWSFGVIMAEMLTGQLPIGNYWITPFLENKPVKRKNKMIFMNHIELAKVVSSAARNLIEEFLQFNPQVRLGYGKDHFLDIMLHRFFQPVDWTKISDDVYNNIVLSV